MLLMCLPQLFLENLEHEDSFIYLSAIRGKTMVQFYQMWWWFVLAVWLKQPLFRSVCFGWFLPWEDPDKAHKRFPTWFLSPYVQQGPLIGNPPQSGRSLDEGKQGYGWVYVQIPLRRCQMDIIRNTFICFFFSCFILSLNFKTQRWTYFLWTFKGQHQTHSEA